MSSLMRVTRGEIHSQSFRGNISILLKDNVAQLDLLSFEFAEFWVLISKEFDRPVFLIVLIAYSFNM